MNSTRDRHRSGIRDGEQHGDEGSVVEPDHGRVVRTGRVEYRDGVLHLRLEVRQPIERDGVRQAGTPPVEVDQASERAEAAQETGEIRDVPDCLDVMHPCIDEKEVQRARTDGLVGEMDVAVPREAGLGNLHERILNFSTSGLQPHPSSENPRSPRCPVAEFAWAASYGCLVPKWIPVSRCLVPSRSRQAAHSSVTPKLDAALDETRSDGAARPSQRV